MPTVGLFVTCLVDLHRPNVGFADIHLLERAGCTVSVPEVQVCCGQPAYSSGGGGGGGGGGDDDDTARRIARQVITAFDGYDHVVAPSGSCEGMIIEHDGKLFGDEPDWATRASALAGYCRELVSFLVDVMGVQDTDASFDRSVTNHDRSPC